MHKSKSNYFRWERSFNKNKLRYYYSGSRKQKLAEMRSDRIQEGPGYARLQPIGALDQLFVRSPAFNPITRKFNAKSYRRYQWNAHAPSVEFFWLTQKKQKPIAEYPEEQSETSVSLTGSVDSNAVRHQLAKMNCKKITELILQISQNTDIRKTFRNMVEQRFLEVWASSYPDDLEKVHALLSKENRVVLEMQFERRKQLNALPRYLRGNELTLHAAQDFPGKNLEIPFSM